MRDSLSAFVSKYLPGQYHSFGESQVVEFNADEIHAGWEMVCLKLKVIDAGVLMRIYQHLNFSSQDIIHS